MFKTTYIYELLKGQLSEDGYRHLLNSISYYVRKYNWPKNIIISSEKSSSIFWTPDDINELSHEFFGFIILKDKLKYLNKIPESYLSYYFLQMFISFVADRIKLEQKKLGLSFERCEDLVFDISRSDHLNLKIDGIDYVYNRTINKNEIKSDSDIENVIKYLSKIPLNEKIKHIRPLVKMAIEDIFNRIESPIRLKKLVEFVYALFDQKSFILNDNDKETSSFELRELNNQKHKAAILNLLSDLTKKDAKLILEYLFQGDSSLSDLTPKYNMSKSSIYSIVKKFKEKIVKTYTPENEEDGILFIQNIEAALEKLSK